MKRPKSWALCVALQLGACGMAGCNTTPSLPPVGGQASVQDHQTIEQQMAAARFMENQGYKQNDPSKLESARQAYMSILARRPGIPFAHHRLAILAARGGQFDAAEIHFQNAVAAKMPSSDLLADMGYNYYLQNRLDDAEAKLREAVEKDPRNLTAMNNLGLVLGEMGKPQEALAQFERVVPPAEAHANLAKVFTHLGQLEEAKAEYNVAVSLDRHLRPAAEALVELETATKNRDRLPDSLPAEHMSREQLASHREVERSGERDVMPRTPGHHQANSRGDSLPDFDQKYGSAPMVHPASQQTRFQESQPSARQPANQQSVDGYFESAVHARESQDAYSRNVAAREQAVVNQAVVDRSAQYPEQSRQSVADLAAAKFGRIDSSATDSNRQLTASPSFGEQPQRSASAAHEMRTRIADEPAVFNEPPLPGGQPDYVAFAETSKAAVESQRVKAAPAQTAPPSSIATAAPSGPNPATPALVENPYYDEQSNPAPATDHRAMENRPAEQPMSTSGSSLRFASSQVIGEGATNEATTPATAAEPAPQHDMPIGYDLPAGEPSLGPIPTVAAQTVDTQARGTPYDFRIPTGVRARSLQDLINGDDDY